VLDFSARSPSPVQRGDKRFSRAVASRKLKKPGNSIYREDRKVSKSYDDLVDEEQDPDIREFLRAVQHTAENLWRAQQLGRFSENKIYTLAEFQKLESGIWPGRKSRPAGSPPERQTTSIRGIEKRILTIWRSDRNAQITHRLLRLPKSTTLRVLKDAGYPSLQSFVEHLKTILRTRTKK
jgi:hypothetical protein